MKRRKGSLHEGRGLEEVDSAGGRVEMLQEVIQVTHHNSNKFWDRKSPQKQRPAQKNPREIHGLSCGLCLCSFLLLSFSLTSSLIQKEGNLKTQAKHEGNNVFPVDLGPKVDDGEYQGRAEDGEIKDQTNSLKKRSSQQKLMGKIPLAEKHTKGWEVTKRMKQEKSMKKT